MWHPMSRASTFIKALNRGVCICVAVCIVCDLFLPAKTIPIFRQAILYSTKDTTAINLNVKVESGKKKSSSNSTWPNKSPGGQLVYNLAPLL